MSPRTHRLMVAGIIAYGDGCSGASIINTKVSSYMDWIKETTQSKASLPVGKPLTPVKFVYNLVFTSPTDSICYSR